MELLLALEAMEIEQTGSDNILLETAFALSFLWEKQWGLGFPHLTLFMFHLDRLTLNKLNLNK